MQPPPNAARIGLSPFSVPIRRPAYRAEPSLPSRYRTGRCRSCIFPSAVPSGGPWRRRSAGRSDGSHYETDRPSRRQDNEAVQGNRRSPQRIHPTSFRHRENGKTSRTARASEPASTDRRHTVSSCSSHRKNADTSKSQQVMAVHCPYVPTASTFRRPTAFPPKTKFPPATTIRGRGKFFKTYDPAPDGGPSESASRTTSAPTGAVPPPYAPTANAARSSRRKTHSSARSFLRFRLSAENGAPADGCRPARRRRRATFLRLTGPTDTTEPSRH
mgnify:CR=1 FL=1